MKIHKSKRKPARAKLIDTTTRRPRSAKQPTSEVFLCKCVASVGVVCFLSALFSELAVVWTIIGNRALLPASGHRSVCYLRYYVILLLYNKVCVCFVVEYSDSIFILNIYT